MNIDIDKLTYSQALEMMEKLLREMESGEIDVDQLTEKAKLITALLNHCKSRLRLAQEGVQNIINPQND